MTGALIGLIVGEPLLAVPAALASHYICDAIPHYGSNIPMKKRARTDLFRNYLIAEAMLCAALVIILALARPEHWQLAAVCAFLAAAPDLLSINRYVKFRYKGQWKSGLYSRFAASIQWFERPIGAVVEIVWFIGCVALMLPLLRAA